MSTGFFGSIEPIAFEGPDSTNPLAYRFYDADEVVMGKRMEDHLRFAVCYWHNFCWPGIRSVRRRRPSMRSWMAAGGDPMEQAKLKADVAFEMFTDPGNAVLSPSMMRDIASGRQDAGGEATSNVNAIADVYSRVKWQAETGIGLLLWGTANMFSNRRFMSGAATNPDPDVFAYAAATGQKLPWMSTHRLGGANYVLWGGREGYETLLNTDVKRELDQLGRFLNMVVEYKHKIGFQGARS